MVWRCSIQYTYGFCGDRLGDVLTDLVRVRHEALGALEALVFEEVLQAEVSADVGEVTAGLQHHQGDEPAVGRPEVPDRGIDRDVRGRGEWGGGSPRW